MDYSDNGSLPAKNKYANEFLGLTEQTPLKFPNITHMKGNERSLMWAKGRPATLDTSIHFGRYFADLVGIQGTVCADNAASTLRLPSVWENSPC